MRREGNGCVNNYETEEKIINGEIFLRQAYEVVRKPSEIQGKSNNSARLTSPPSSIYFRVSCPSESGRSETVEVSGLLLKPILSFGDLRRCRPCLGFTNSRLNQGKEE